MLRIIYIEEQKIDNCALLGSNFFNFSLLCEIPVARGIKGFIFILICGVEMNLTPQMVEAQETQMGL